MKGVNLMPALSELCKCQCLQEAGEEKHPLKVIMAYMD